MCHTFGSITKIETKVHPNKIYMNTIEFVFSIGLRSAIITVWIMSNHSGKGMFWR